MIRLSGLNEVELLYAARGWRNYGEGVTQLEHAVQCASWAQAHVAAPSLIAAAFLHDIGHLFEEDEDVAERDDHHEFAGAQALKYLFDEAVRGPIALHVAAKRYLCFKEPGYFQTLSPASRASLVLQGGPFDIAKATAFEQLSYCQEAVALRRFDDMGKREESSGRDFSDFAPLLSSLLLDRAGL